MGHPGVHILHLYRFAAWATLECIIVHAHRLQRVAEETAPGDPGDDPMTVELRQDDSSRVRASGGCPDGNSGGSGSGAGSRHPTRTSECTVAERMVAGGNAYTPAAKRRSLSQISPAVTWCVLTWHRLLSTLGRGTCHWHTRRVSR